MDPFLPQVLDVKLPFDERQLIIDNLAYLTRSLKLETIAVHPITDEAAVKAAANPIDATLAYPGNPVSSLTLVESGGA